MQYSKPSITQFYQITNVVTNGHASRQADRRGDGGGGGVQKAWWSR